MTSIEVLQQSANRVQISRQILPGFQTELLGKIPSGGTLPRTQTRDLEKAENSSLTFVIQTQTHKE